MNLMIEESILELKSLYSEKYLLYNFCLLIALEFTILNKRIKKIINLILLVIAVLRLGITEGQTAPAEGGCGLGGVMARYFLFFICLSDCISPHRRIIVCPILFLLSCCITPKSLVKAINGMSNFVKNQAFQKILFDLIFCP